MMLCKLCIYDAYSEYTMTDIFQLALSAVHIVIVIVIVCAHHQSVGWKFLLKIYSFDVDAVVEAGATPQFHIKCVTRIAHSIFILRNFYIRS